MKIGIIKGIFDPITVDTIQYALKERKEKHLDYVWFEVEEGKKENTAYSLRTQMVEKALRPYRKVSLAYDKHKEDIYVDLNFSSELEEKVRHGEFQYVPTSVKKIIFENCLYAHSIASFYCSEKRYAHVVSMTNMALKLAKQHHVDVRKAFLAGMFHDIAKEMDKEEALRIMKIYYPDKVGINPHLFHSYTGMLFVRDTLGLKDKDVLSAIFHHVIGDGNKKLDKIIFIADKIDPSRGYDISEHVRISMKDLDAGVKYVKKEQSEYLEKEGIHA